MVPADVLLALEERVQLAEHLAQLGFLLLAILGVAVTLGVQEALERPEQPRRKDLDCT
jgi:hypothetical protein